jgi:uncharacterized coiled-coil protein SlyX
MQQQQLIEYLDAKIEQQQQEISELQEQIRILTLSKEYDC